MFSSEKGKFLLYFILDFTKFLIEFSHSGSHEKSLIFGVIKVTLLVMVTTIIIVMQEAV